jgi:predicted Zn-ribbon and HTH transcriptional regulator
VRKDKILVCPECESEEVTVAEIQRFMVNTNEHWCFSVKAHDSNAPARCIDCAWEGERKELKEVNHD